MTEQEILNTFQSLSIWRSGDRRAPHKPLLLLLAIGYMQNDDQRLLPYNQVDPKLKELLTKFGTPRNAGNTHYPFWRLCNDGIWEVERGDELTLNSSGGVKKTELRDKEIRAGFDLWLERFHGDTVNRPVRAVYEPGVDYIAWNHEQVFKSPGRVR